MTEKELQLISELEEERKSKTALETLIQKKKIKLKNCVQKITDLELAVKEEQLNSIRESIDKNGLDFNAFREALERGQLSSIVSVRKENKSDTLSDNERENDL